MIGFLSGEVFLVSTSTISLLVHDLGFVVFTPRPETFSKGQKVTLHTHLHWNQDQGPTLYGFEDELTKTVFTLIIDCPKIGPKIALGILSQLSAPHFLEAITSRNHTALSNLNGIGAKKAEQLIMELNGKVTKMVSAGILSFKSEDPIAQWSQLGDALASLGYTRQEIGRATNHVTQSTPKNAPFDQLLRSALALLAQGG